MKRFVLAMALTCALSVTAMAGEIPSTGITAPGEVPTTGLTSPGDIPGVDLSIWLTILSLAF